MSFTVGNRNIGVGYPVFVIAEIGVNHEGDFQLCKEMVHQAALAGADAIKLQTVDPDENYVKGTPSWELFKTCELTVQETKEIFKLAQQLGLVPLTTSPDLHTLQWVDKTGVDIHKISSGMMTNDFIVKKTCETNKIVLLSTGMGNTEQIDHAVNIAKSSNNKKIALFQCTSQYPAPNNSLNLASIKWLSERYELPVGFSDHSDGIDAAAVAVTLGAMMIEKHFSLEKSRDGYDHRLSLEPTEFKAMVEGIRRAEHLTFEDICGEVPDAKIMVGKAERTLSKELQDTAAGNTRCLVARMPIKRGSIFDLNNVGLKRPFPDKRGLEPYELENVLGKVSTNDLSQDDPIRLDDVAK